MIKSTRDAANMVFRLPFQNILTAFQIGNPNVYNIVRNNPETEEGFLNFFANALLQKELKEGEFLSGQRSCTISNIGVNYRFSPSEDGGFAFAMTYTLNREGMIPEDRFSLIIGQNKYGDEDMITTEPHYILCGGVYKDTFMPEESLCLVEMLDEQRVMMGARNEDEFYATLCYADTALKSVISGFPLDMDQNSLFLTEEARSSVCNLFKHMTQRNSATLTQEIREGVVYRDGRETWSPPSLQ